MTDLMVVGTFFVCIEDAAGRLLSTVERTSYFGRPAVGDELVIEGRLYRVERVRYEDEPEDRTVRRYLDLRVFVRAMGRAPPVLPLKRRR